MTSVSNFKVGIVRLGKVGGKTKYSLLDEKCLPLVEQYAFEAKLELDANGDGAKILAWLYDVNRSRSSGQYLHEILWELYCGGIAPGWQVVHRNGITLDNRLDNLVLFPLSKSYKIQEDLNQKFKKEESLYWSAIKQLPEEIFHHDQLASENITSEHSYSGKDKPDECSMPEDALAIFECHYPPCTNMEKHIRQFSICGRCRLARYCGINCQQWHWNSHKKNCKERRRVMIKDFILDR